MSHETVYYLVEDDHELMITQTQHDALLTARVIYDAADGGNICRFTTGFYVEGYTEAMAALAEPAEAPATPEYRRSEATLQWIQAYDGHLNRLEIAPNGDDYNQLFAAVVSILVDGIVPVMPEITSKGR